MVKEDVSHDVRRDVNGQSTDRIWKVCKLVQTNGQLPIEVPYHI